VEIEYRDRKGECEGKNPDFVAGGVIVVSGSQVQVKACRFPPDIDRVIKPSRLVKRNLEIGYSRANSVS
ncbi:hypothetical protein, partial [Paraburkholderia sp. SIMBA_030]|uniref:hypothetical protein n=1 Tax=Paraburkholderia sp. SIMBA_030 TaxID=3085773 RepID=UPI0039788768